MAISKMKVATEMRNFADDLSKRQRERDHSIYIGERNYEVDEALNNAIEVLHASARVLERG